MSETEWRKVDALEHVTEGDWTMEMGAQAAGLSVRHFRRLRRAYEAAEEPHTVVVHGNTARAPPNRIDDAVREKTIQVRREKYDGFNDTHSSEKLKENEEVAISRQSVQRILREAGISSPKQRRARKHRKRRERRSREGWMVLWDGSIHDWLEGRGPAMCLMAAIDDATGKILRGAHFVQRECSAGYLRALYEFVRHHGVPLEVYMDKHSCLRRNDDNWTLEEQLAGRQEPPQVQRALESLGIDVIWANSPQAKGRIERAFGTFQDRLVSELRLANVSTLEQANEVLEQYRRKHNKCFAKKPKDKSPAWRKLPKGFGLAEVCSFHTTATVNNDNTISYQGMVISLPRVPGIPSLARKTVDIRHLLSGLLRVYLGETLVCQTQTAPPTKAPKRKRRKPSTPKPAAPKKRLTFKQIVEKYGGVA